MHELLLEGIDVSIAGRLRPFFSEILEHRAGDIHSIYLTGSALTDDFSERHSDINSLIVLNRITFDFLRFLAPLGKRFGQKGLAAPLLMTPEYIAESLDAFPMEFLDLKLIHRTLYGEDIIRAVRIERRYLRLQCEREIKSRLIGLRQGYISQVGDPARIQRMLSHSIKGCIPLFRAIINLKGVEPPAPKTKVIHALALTTGTPGDAFLAALSLRFGEQADTPALFEEYYRNLEHLSSAVNALGQ
jgi:predicted nucleotidyltransferase